MAYSWSMLDVLRLLDIKTNPYKAEVRITCPFCGKSRMDINQPKGVGHCWACDKGVDSASLYAVVQGLSLFKAREEIKERLGIDENDQKNGTYPARIVYKSVVQESVIKDVKQRDSVYRAFLNELTLSTKNRMMLIARGFNEEDIETYMYRTLPSRDEIDFVALCNRLLRDGYDLNGIPGFFRLKNGKWTFAGMTKGILMPQIDRENLIFGLQLRKDDDLRKFQEETGEIEQKCCWFSSKNCRNGCGAKASESVNYACDFVFRDGKYVPVLKDIIILTEGSMKADLIHSFLKEAPVVSIPGVNILDAIINSVTFWIESGVKKVLLCYDMDYKTNEHVQGALSKTYSILKEAGLDVIRKDWQTEVNVNGVNYYLKGIDDYLAYHIKGILPQIIEK